MSQRHATPRRTKTKVMAAVGVLTMLFGALLVFAPGAGAAKGEDKTAPFNVVYNGFTVDDNDTPDDTSDDTTTFRYELTGPAGEAVSHAVFGEFCERPSSFDPSYSEDKTGSADPTTNKLGFKWDGDQANPVGQVYAITFDGVHDDEGTVEWSIKKGSKDGSVKSVSLAGPSCETETDPCQNAPQSDLECFPCDEQGDERDECDPCVDAPQSDLECFPCDEQGDERDECDPCIDAPQSDLECHPCTAGDTRPGCPPRPTCVELRNCPKPPPPNSEIDDATLTIAKMVTGDDLDEWTFGFDGDLDAFVLTDDVDSKSFDLDPGKYTVTETDAGLATFDDIECDDDALVVIDLEEASVTVDLSEGDDVTCTFINDYELEILPEETPPTAETPPAKAPQAQAPQAKAPQAQAPAAKTVTSEAEVLGETATRTLPRTGSSSTGNLAIAGIALMLFGAVLVGGSRRLQMVR